MRVRLFAVPMLLLVSIASAGPNASQKVTGGGFYVVTLFGQQYETHFGLNAIKSDGTVKGKLELRAYDNEAFAHVDIQYAEFSGNVACFSGVIQRGDSGPLAPFFGGVRDVSGWIWVQAVKDNGEGKNAAPDRISNGALLNPAVGWTAANAIALVGPGRKAEINGGGGFALAGGNVQVAE